MTLRANGSSEVTLGIPRSTHPFVLAAPAVAMVLGVTSPCAGSFVKALNVPAAGVHAQPSPKVEAPMSDGAAAFVTSRYLRDTCDELALFSCPRAKS
jgi:hypothetical protein